jgi:hypothetical protein
MSKWEAFGVKPHLMCELEGPGRGQVKMLDGIPILDLTPSVLLGVTVLMFLLGKIVPRSALQDKIDEADKWRKAYEAEREAHLESFAQTTRVIEFASRQLTGDSNVPISSR